jgi:uncharacterized protein YbaP (TraB family)
MLPEGLEWQTPAFRQAMSASEALVTEAVIGDDPAVAGQAMTKVAFSPGLPPLAERVPAEKRAALAAMIEQTELPAATLDRLETWAAALSLLSVSFSSSASSPSRASSASWRRATRRRASR